MGAALPIFKTTLVSTHQRHPSEGHVLAMLRPKPRRNLDGRQLRRRTDGRKDGPSTNELVDVRAGGLESSTRYHADSAQPNGGSATEAIGEVGREGVAGEGTDVLERKRALSICAGTRAYRRLTYLDGVKETEDASVGAVEERLPLVHGLETVHQTTVVTVGGGGDEATRDSG